MIDAKNHKLQRHSSEEQNNNREAKGSIHIPGRTKQIGSGVGGRTDAVSGALKECGLAGREGRDGGNRTREREGGDEFLVFEEWKVFFSDTRMEVSDDKCKAKTGPVLKIYRFSPVQYDRRFFLGCLDRYLFLVQSDFMSMVGRKNN
ncbi:hypothetical protein QL285_084493 [Trifolium repens]|nr:hypothetical protein QL285_084493 [Trifolium repens]